jgi:hypothetical protein
MLPTSFTHPRFVFFTNLHKIFDFFDYMDFCSVCGQKKYFINLFFVFQKKCIPLRFLKNKKTR